MNAYYNLGQIFKSRGEYQCALDAFDKVIVINPNYVQAHNARGLVFVAQKRFDEAVEAFKKALTVNPKFVAAYINLLDVLKKQGK